MTYDVLIIGGGPGGIYTAWELLNKRPDLKLALFESGHTLERRRCPIDGVKVMHSLQDLRHYERLRRRRCLFRRKV